MTASVEGLSPDDRKTLRKAISELNDSLTRISAERDLQKEIINDMNDKLGVDKKLIRKMAQTYYKSNYGDVIEENNAFEEFYSQVIQKTVV